MNKTITVPKIWKTQPWVFPWSHWWNSSRNQGDTLAFFLLYKFLLTIALTIVHVSDHPATGSVTVQKDKERTVQEKWCFPEYTTN